MMDERQTAIVKFRTTRILVMFLGIALLGGCATGTTNLKPDTDVAGKFQRNDIMEGYRYFHYSVGFDRRTYAIIGLAPPYVVDSRLWREVEDTGEVQSLVRDLTRWSSSEPRGYLITTPEGNEVGMWFSAFFGSSVRFADSHRVIPILNLPTRFRGGDSVL